MHRNFLIRLMGFIRFMNGIQVDGHRWDCVQGSQARWAFQDVSKKRLSLEQMTRIGGLRLDPAIEVSACKFPCTSNALVLGIQVDLVIGTCLLDLTSVHSSSLTTSLALGGTTLGGLASNGRLLVSSCDRLHA
ncbi:unnamed protein product [Cuscuta campestris]|uniref:Uncharacterized protein n=1 Tax=Cuscuta campestris TaxID=132261 RepID=A0A484LNR3_9ASTE|nr:unnamed protein product [Cuscuta campestris]